MAVNPKTHGIIIVGRSDGVLNPSGVRFGSAEIYSVLESFCSAPEEGVEDTLCVGQRRPGVDNDERVLLFVKMRVGSGKKLTKDLETRMKDRIAKELSRRHVPAYIFEVEDIPVSISVDCYLRLGLLTYYLVGYGEHEKDRNCCQTNCFWIQP